MTPIQKQEQIKSQIYGSYNQPEAAQQQEAAAPAQTTTVPAEPAQGQAAEEKQ